MARLAYSSLEWTLQHLAHSCRLPEEPAAADAGLGMGTGAGTGTRTGLVTAGDGTTGTTLRRFSGGGGASTTT